MSSWRASYAGYDDQALVMIANAGLVRRAAKVLPEVVQRESGSDYETFEVSGFTVRLDAQGPAKGRCSCPTAGVCVHVLAAAMKVRKGATEPQPSQNREDTAVLTELLALSPALLFRKAGIAAVRQAYARFDERPLVVTPQEHYVDIAWEDQQVRYVAGAGFEGMVSAAPASEHKALHLEALARLFVAHGVAWEWPAGVVVTHESSTGGLTPPARKLLSVVQDEVSQVISNGLAHTSTDASARMHELALDARLAHLPLLGRMLGAAATLLAALVQHRDDVSELEVTGILARVWALSDALSQDASPPEALIGSIRRTFSADDAPALLTLIPLGAIWWVSDSGARGVTLAAWDEEANQVRAVTSARPVGLDATFYRQPGLTALWETAISTLLGSGSFQVAEPRAAADGTLSPTARGITCMGRHIADQTLRKIASELEPGELNAGLANLEQRVALVEVSGFGKLALEETKQQLVWRLPLEKNEWILRQEITPSTVHRVDALMALEAQRAKLKYVLARQVIVQGRTVWEPVTCFLKTKGEITLFSLDFSQAPRGSTIRSALQKRLPLLIQRWSQAANTPVFSRSPIAIACDDVRELTVDLAATGRLWLTPEQQRRCSALITRLDDLALVTLAHAARTFASQPGVKTMLRLHHLADRVALLTADRL